jgi:queuine tRNA-ribosyltransferase
LFTQKGIINIKNEKWKDDFSPVDPDGDSFVDQAYSRAFLRHLFASKEMLGPMVASIHNLRFYAWLVEEARRQILNSNFSAWKSGMVKSLAQRL